MDAFSAFEIISSVAKAGCFLLVFEGFSRYLQQVRVWRILTSLWLLKLEVKKWRVCEMNGLVLEQ